MKVTDLHLGAEISIPADWRRVIARDCPIRLCPPDLEATVLRLQHTQGAEALLDLGLLQQNVDGVALNRALRIDQVWLHAHVDPDSGEIVGISTAGGLLTAGGLSMARSLEIAVAHELRNEPAPRLFFTSDVRDLAALSALGYVARPIEFLSLDNWCELDELYDLLGWRDTAEIETRFDVDDEILLGLTDQRQLDAIDEGLAGDSQSLSLADAEWNFSDHFSAIILAWSPAALARDLPAGFLDIIENLKRLQTVLGRDTSMIAIWWPDQAMLDRLRFVLNRGTERDVQSILERSLQEDLWALDGFSPHPPGPPSFLDALNELDHLPAKGDPAGWQRSTHNFMQAYSRDIIEPLFYASSRCDPESRSLHATTVMLEKLLGAQYCDIQKGIVGGSPGMLSAKNISLLLATTDRLLRSFKAGESAP